MPLPFTNVSPPPDISVPKTFRIRHLTGYALTFHQRKPAAGYICADNIQNPASDGVCPYLSSASIHFYYAHTSEIGNNKHVAEL